MFHLYGGRKSAESLASRVVLPEDAAKIAGQYDALFERAVTGSPNNDAVVFADMAEVSQAARRLTTDNRRRLVSPT
jgi:hypothetical protein